MIDDFTAKLGHALKAAELSRSRLAKLAGVDKSVASRWVSGATQPSEANLDALTTALSAKLPDLRLTDWSRPLAEFMRRFPLAGDPTSAEALSTSDTTTDALPNLPSIAVLPFANMSGDPDQEFFGDGIAEDILTALSKLRWLFVVARNSSFAYKGQNIDVREVSRDLGVRYVLEGSVRRSGNRVRVTSQLIDATTGAHVWADRFDRELTDIFAVQDEIVNAVITAIAPAIVDAERQRAFAKPTYSLDAWEAYQRGLWHYAKRDVKDAEIARKLFTQSVTLDPNFAPAYLGLAMTHITDGYVYHHSDHDEALRKAEANARKAVALDESSTMARVYLGYVFRMKGQFSEALREAERTLREEPNNGIAYGLLGVTNVSMGRYAEGERAIRSALSLGLRDPRRPVWVMHIAVARYLAGNYEGALLAARELLTEFPLYPAGHRWLAAILGQLGRIEEGRAAMAESLRLSNPAATKRLGQKPTYLSSADFKHMTDGLAKVGWTATS